MIETVASRLWVPIIGTYGGSVSTSQLGRAWYQAPLDRASEGLFARRQSVFPRGRRMVDGVSSHDTCGLRVHQSVQAIGRRGVPRQVWGSSCVSGSRDTTPNDSSARGLGKAAQLQVGRIRHDRQHSKRQQSDLVWLQTLRSRGAVLICQSTVLEEETLVAIQRPCCTQGKAQGLLKRVVLAQPQEADIQNYRTQGSRSKTMERLQGCTKMQSLWRTASCCHRLSSHHQGRQEVGQQADRRTQQPTCSDTRS